MFTAPKWAAVSDVVGGGASLTHFGLGSATLVCVAGIGVTGSIIGFRSLRRGHRQGEVELNRPGPEIEFKSLVLEQLSS